MMPESVVLRFAPTTCEPRFCQQYLHKVPNGYCPIHATGVKLADG
jgi:hypothetical protein